MFATQSPASSYSCSTVRAHPFVKSAVPVEKQILGSAFSDHSPMSKATKSMGIGNTRSLRSDPEKLAIHSSRESKSNYNPSDVYIPRNISCPVSPTVNPLLHPRSPHHPSGRMSPSPISSPLTTSGSSTPLTGGIGAIPYNQSTLIPDGFSIVPKRPPSPCANTLSYWDPDILKGMNSGSHIFRELASCHNNALARKFGRVAHAELYDRQSILADCVARQLQRDPAQLNPSVDLNPSSPFPSHRMTGL